MFRKTVQILVCTILMLQIFSADRFVVQKPQLREYIVFLFDWDNVIADQKSKYGQLFSALCVVPFKESKKIIFNGKYRKQLIKTMKGAHRDGQKLKGAADNIDVFFELEPSLKEYRSAIMNSINDAWPRTAMVSYAQQVQKQGATIVIVTNNDYETLYIKTKKLNWRLSKKKRAPLLYDACFCAGKVPQLVNNKSIEGISTGAVYGGKDTDEYFVELFKFVEKQFGYDRTKILYVFVDDLEKNIIRARHVAQQENVALCAVVRDKSDTKIIAEIRAALAAYGK